MPLIQVAEKILKLPNQLEKTWQAINVGAPVADMSFGSAQLIDESTGVDYIFRQGEPVVPVDLPLGHYVGASFLCTNSGEVTLAVFVYIEIIDPDGVARASAWLPGGSLPAIVNPDVGYYSEQIGGVLLDKSGLWQIYGRLEYEIA